MKTEHKIMAVSVMFGLFFWIIDAALDYFIFYEGTLLSLLLTDVPAHEVYTRLVVMASFLAFGVLMSGVVGRRKRVEAQRDAMREALQSSEERFRSLVEQANVGIIVTREGKVVYCNQKESDLLGYENPSDLRGRSLAQMLHEDDLPRLFNMGERIRLGEAMTSPITFRAMRRDGSVRVLQALAVPFSIEKEGDLLSFHTDVTERVRTEEKLRESEEQLRLLVESAEDVIIMQDLEGRYLHFHGPPQYGFEPDDVLGKTPFDFHDPETAAEFLERLKKVAASGESLDFESQVNWQGKTAWFLDQLSPVRDSAGNVRAVVTVSRNITERVRFEADKEAMQSQRGVMLEALQERTRDLDERVKELDCLYGISRLVEKPGITLDEIMQGTVDLMPLAWRYPEIACARIVLDAQEFRTENCEEIVWRQAGDIVVRGERIGAVEAGYLEARPESDEEPFLKEEQSLINAIAERLGRVIERVWADDALRESRERFRALAQVSPVGIFRTDAKGHCLYVNDRWCEIAGLTLQEARGQGWAQGIHPDDRERVFAEWYKSAQEELPFESEYRFRRPDGVTTWVFGQAMAERGDSGEIAGYVGTVTDVTERRQSAEALKRHNEELMARNAIATTIGQSLDLDHILNATLVKVLEVIGMDSGSIQLLDEQRGVLSLAAHRGLSPELVQRAQTIEPGESLSGKVAQSGQAVVTDEVSDDPRLELEIAKREGMRVYIGVPIQVRDKVLGVLSISSHSPRQPERREVELLTAIGHQLGVAVENARLAEQASEIEILRELGRLRAELIANVSHELRTPLGLIKIFCTTLLREDVDFDEEVQIEFLRDIEQETVKLEEIVDNLLDLSLIRDGRLRLDKRPTDLGQLARDVITSMELQVTPHRFVHDFFPPLVTRVDSKRIEQVLRNVLNNAVKYSPDGGTIAVRVRGNGQQFLIQVTDQGIGIASKDLDKVFERFYRVENEATRAASGAGLGLSVCQGIIQAHGGRMWVRSTPGQGSTFYFTLPVDDRSAD